MAAPTNDLFAVCCETQSVASCLASRASLVHLSHPLNGSLMLLLPPLLMKPANLRDRTCNTSIGQQQTFETGAPTVRDQAPVSKGLKGPLSS